jgi:hypothetical protein
VPPAEPDRTRFDSGVFRFPPIEPGPKQDQDARRNPAAHALPTAELPTTDQLDQLQRRRGERRAAPEPTTDTDSLPVTRAMDVVETGDVFAPRPAPAQQQAAQPRRESASVHQLPVRAQQATPAAQTAPAAAPQRNPQPAPVRSPQAAPAQQRVPQQTAPIPPAFARPAAGSAFARPTPAPPRQEQQQEEDRRADQSRRRRDRGRPALEQAQPADEVQDTEPPVPAARPRRGRTSMPSWDEIVFGRDEP